MTDCPRVTAALLGAVAEQYKLDAEAFRAGFLELMDELPGLEGSVDGYVGPFAAAVRKYSDLTFPKIAAAIDVKLDAMLAEFRKSRHD